MISKLNNPEVLEFIQQNVHEDAAKVALQAKKFPGFPIREIADQIASRKKAVKKLPEWASNPRVIFPKRQNLEQASSEKTARYKAGLVSGHNVLDLTGGTGVDAFYFWDNFDHVTIVEPNPELCDLILYNFEVLGKKVNLIQNTAEDFLQNNTDHFDLIYLDPSRRDKSQKRVFGLSQYQPDVLEMYSEITHSAERVMIKASPMIDIPKTVTQLPGCSMVYTIAVQNEMKEVLFLLNHDKETEIQISAINLRPDSVDEFLFSQEDESKTQVNFSTPLKYVYDPNSAIRKAGAFKSIGQRFDLPKLHEKTHLYTSDHYLEGFPGRIFKCTEVVKADKKNIKKRFPKKKVHLVSRNYPVGANDLKKKFGLIDGGEEFLFFCEIKGLGKTALVCTWINQ